MRAVIVDDDSTQRALLNKLCENSGFFTEVSELDSALKLIAWLKENEVDLILLDIQMPDFTGIDFIKSIKDRPNVIFITGETDFAIDAFEHDALDYLLKPVQMGRFLKAINKAKDEVDRRSSDMEKTVDFIFIKVDSKQIKLNVDDILWIEAKGDYVSFQTEKKAYIVLSTLKKIQKDLPASIFKKSHRSYIVNVNKIKDIEDSTMVIHQSVIPIGRSFKKEFLQDLGL